MSICTIYTVSTDSDRKYESGSVKKHYEMNNWLNENGQKDWYYELYRGGSLHSKWIWKEKPERWGRTATPTKKESTVSVDNQSLKRDRESRKKTRQKKAKYNQKGRQPQG